MTQQDKELLLRDLCARLPYGVIFQYGNQYQFYLNEISKDKCSAWPIEYCKPYLRPISNLTQEERDKFCDIGGVISHRPDGKLYLVTYFPEALDYLNSIHADYRGMIEKGLAIEVTDENNPYK